MSTERAAYLFSQYPPQAFSYDADTRRFTIGDEQIALQDYGQYTASPTDSIELEQAAHLINTTPLALNVFGNHYQLPRMYNWITGLDKNGWNDVSESVTEIMMTAYSETSGDARSQLEKGTHWGFGVGLYRPGHPVFSVIGDCACYGVSPHGVIGEDYWSEGLAEYSAHNIDWKAQIVALHAGAGALASLCTLDTEK
jgi:hypothetical protein